LFLLLVPIALSIGELGWTALLVATAGSFLVQRGVPKLAVGPTLLDAVGRLMVVVGVVVFFVLVAIEAAKV
jgi:hypothetical protein